MTRISAGLAALSLAALVAIAPIGLALGQDDAVMQKGKQLYTDNCAACHQPSGIGTPPTFPALSNNPHLSDLALVAGNIHNGKNGMPAFPDLTPDDIAAIATYIRNSWGNTFGPVSADDVTAALSGAAAAPAPAAPTATIWDGIYTDAQAQRGLAAYEGACNRCHGPKLNGAAAADMPASPAIARASFLFKWKGKTVQELYDYTKAKMPKDNPGTLSDQQYADIIAYMFQVSGAKPGDAELSTDPAAQGAIAITEAAK